MSKLLPIPMWVPFNVGENVAFKEDHAEQPGKYGKIEALGLDENGDFAFDLRVFDPAKGYSGKEKTVRRTRLEEIQ